ncbi:hypothetical protein [Mitsuaria sp. 7]|uniref:hypothetical protein n=1 Tax=Mitsuaria sp. 7 TaxID=1658665 RepID=UPI0007DCF6D9|nr:hypothetical protein [Mitsuaria sp. 7]ANH68907.1 hypothetical protein ABE85_17410 [Mitsuaria sp. 7]
MLALVASAGVAPLAWGADPPPVSIEFDGPPGASSRLAAQGAMPRQAVPDLRVRYVRIKSRWADAATLPIAACDVLTNDRISAAMNALRQQIGESPAATGVLGRQGRAEVLFIGVEYDLSTGRGDECPGGGATAGVTLEPYHVRVDLARLGDNVLPIPRAGTASLYDHVPAVLRRFDPQVGAGYDEAFGPTVTAAVRMPLPLSDAADSPMGLSLRHEQSTRSAFHRSEGRLEYRHQPVRRDGQDVLQELRVFANAIDRREPVLGGELQRSAGEAGLGATMKPAIGVRVALDGSWQAGRDETTLANGVDHRADTRRLTARVLTEWMVPRAEGVLRAGVWAERVRPDGVAPLARWSARLGYAREFSLGSGPTWGLEVMAGAGRVSDRAPAAERFYGGGAKGQFLYDGLGSAALSRAPDGPLLRSAGQGQAGLPGQRGGTRYWHLNAQLAFPIKAWSSPLIPDERVDLGDTDSSGQPMPPIPLKTLLGNQLDVSGPSMLVATLVAQGKSNEEATREADAAFDEVRPAAHFIIDKASLHAVRPLLLMDVAGLSDGAGQFSARWVAVGVGVGVTVVTARLEGGVMHTVSGPAIQGGRNAAFLRMVFQNLF